MHYKKRRKSGFILLLVVAMIALIGVVLAILSVNSKTLTLRTHRELLKARAEQAELSGLAWVRQHPGDVQSLTSENPIMLTIEDSTVQVNCRIERVRDAEGKEILQITGHAEDRRFSSDVKHPAAFPESR